MRPTCSFSSIFSIKIKRIGFKEGDNVTKSSPSDVHTAPSDRDSKNSNAVLKTQMLVMSWLKVDNIRIKIVTHDCRKVSMRILCIGYNRR